jgi:murein DD-endopeptidase MepM/ murein hydrolase activator NlpD
MCFFNCRFYRVFAVLLAMAAVFFFACAEKEEKSVEEITDSIKVADSLNVVEDSLSRYVQGEIQPNQGLFQALRSLDVDNASALYIVNVLRFNVELTNLKVGEKIRVLFSGDSAQITEFVYEPNPVVDHKLVLDTATGKLKYLKEELPSDTTYRLIAGKLEEGSTLNQSLLDMDVPTQLTQVINGVLMCKISFRTDARQGDSFTAMLKEVHYKDTWISGSVLYVSYSGVRTGFHEAFRYVDEDPKSSYNAHYTPTGQALVHSGLRYPLDRLHIVSSYGRRYHPVSGRRRMHYGVDYRASTGTPIYSVAKGHVVLSGYDRYSGNKIAIRHADRSTSYYLHLSKKMVRKGQKVVSRQIIGRVGSTGYVTGAHLHFGFKNSRGRWINPLSKRMIATPKLTGERLVRLKQQIRKIRDLVEAAEATRYPENEPQLTHNTLSDDTTSQGI